MIRDRSLPKAVNGHLAYKKPQRAYHPILHHTVRFARGQEPQADPTVILINVEWLNQFLINPANMWFFNRIPVRTIIEIITSVPTYENYEDYFWGHIENTFDPDELNSFTSEQYNAIEIFVETLIEHFYQRLNILAPRLDGSYIFDRWLADDTILMVRDDSIAIV